MKMGTEGLKLLKSFESCSLTAYKGAGEKYYTIGWGHCGPDIKKGQKISQQLADQYLVEDLKTREAYVEKYVKSFKPNQNQFDALVDYVYNRGVKGLIELCNNSKTASDFSKNILVYWGSNTAAKKGIMRRRQAEKKLFDTPVESKNEYPTPLPAPTKILRYDKTLKVDDEVKWLQYRLNRTGLFSEDLVIDGKFGKGTLAAVKAFQKHEGLVVDGEVGPKTIAALL